MGRRLKQAIDGSPEAALSLPELQPAHRALARLERALHRGRCPTSLSPLYLHGPTGCGKSHLVEQFLGRQSEELTTFATTGRELGRLLGQAEVLSPLESARLLIVEDLSSLPTAASDGLSNLLDRRASRRGPVIVTALIGPALLTRHGSRLRSRLAGGLVLQVPALGPESRRRFLREMAEKHGVSLEEAALNWLVEQLPGSFRQLQGAVNRLAAIDSMGMALTQAQAQKALREALEGKEALTSERIAREVGRFYRVQPARLRGKSRQRAAMIPRQVAMYLMRVLLGLPLEAIGAYFGGRDHTTVLHACRKVQQTLETDPDLAGAVRSLRTALG